MAVIRRGRNRRGAAPLEGTEAEGEEAEEGAKEAQPQEEAEVQALEPFRRYACRAALRQISLQLCGVEM